MISEEQQRYTEDLSKKPNQPADDNNALSNADAYQSLDATIKKVNAKISALQGDKDKVDELGEFQKLDTRLKNMKSWLEHYKNETHRYSEAGRYADNRAAQIIAIVYEALNLVYGVYAESDAREICNKIDKIEEHFKKDESEAENPTQNHIKVKQPNEVEEEKDTVDAFTELKNRNVNLLKIKTSENETLENKTVTVDNENNSKNGLS